MIPKSGNRFSERSCPRKMQQSRPEAKSLFSDLEHLPALVLAVSGGPDSTALMVLAARWRNALKVEAEADRRHRRSRPARGIQARGGGGRHGLRASLGSRTALCAGPASKPKTGLQQAARAARYRLLADAARKASASHILTAHTLDDQAETVLIRMSRGSGVTGLGGDGADCHGCPGTGRARSSSSARCSTSRSRG